MIPSSWFCYRPVKAYKFITERRWWKLFLHFCLIFNASIKILLNNRKPGAYFFLFFFFGFAAHRRFFAILVQLISYKMYLECTLVQWRLPIYLSLRAEVAVGTFFMKSPVLFWIFTAHTVRQTDRQADVPCGLWGNYSKQYDIKTLKTINNRLWTIADMGSLVTN